MDNKVLYELEDILRFFIDEGISDVYVDTVVDMWVLNKLDIKETFNALHTFSQRQEDRLSIFYDVKCPNCSNREGVYKDTLKIGIGTEVCCSKCNSTFIKDTSNIYLFFRISDEWSKGVKEFKRKYKVRCR